MEVEQGSATSSVESTPAPQTSGGEEGQAAPSPEGEVQEYKPDYKFKYYGKEAEMEEWARQFIKDKQTEDRFRSLYAKSNGFDLLKERYTARDGEYSELQQKFQETEATANGHAETLQEIQYLRDNDLQGFFKFCGIPTDKLIDYVEQHLEYLKKPEAERAHFDKASEQAARARELEKENQRLQAQFEQQSLQTHESEFTEYMDHPEVQGFAERYDSLVGKEGAFRQAVIEHGEYRFHKTGEYVKPLDAIRAVYRQYKPFVMGQQSQRDDRTGEAPQGAKDTAAPKRPATIPNLGNGASVSPTKKVFGSLDELKNFVKSRTAED